MLRKNVKLLLEQLQVCIFAEIVFGVRYTLTLFFLWAFLRFLVVTDIDSITKNWKHTKLVLLLRAHDKVSIFVFD